jgi:membrane protease subunit HflK
VKKKNTGRMILWGVIVALAALTALTGFYRVNEGEEAILLTFREMTAKKGPGIYWRLPLVQTVDKVSTSQIHTLELGFRTETGATMTDPSAYTDVNDEALMLTGDDNLVRVEAVCQFSVKDAQSYLYEVDQPESTMKLAFETALRRNIQNKALDDALLSKATIEQEVIPDFQRMLDSYSIGVTVREIRIQNITVPMEVNAAYEDVNNAKNEKTRKLDEAEKYLNEVIPAARSEAYQKIQEAEAYKSEVISQATGDVANFNSVYETYVTSKEITRKRLMIETMEKILEGADKKIVVDGDGSTLRLLPIEPGKEG